LRGELAGKDSSNIGYAAGAYVMGINPTDPSRTESFVMKLDFEWQWVA